jgi:heterotetrameric sarcosine oxidase gamma subunit
MLNQWVGLALLAGGRERHGEVLTVFDALRNNHILGEVCDPVHYDKENTKLFMPELRRPIRTSPLAGIAKPGRFGSPRETPGVELSVLHPASIVTVIARKGCTEPLVAALAELKDCTIHWAGFEQYYVVAKGRPDLALYRELADRLRSIATISDQSHGRIIIRITGPKARQTLAKGSPVDLHPDEFTVGKSALTQMAHVVVYLTRTGGDSFEISLFRGFAESFWEWLPRQAGEFGCQVT